jgi:putative DNA primase/helicase
MTTIDDVSDAVPKHARDKVAEVHNLDGCKVSDEDEEGINWGAFQAELDDPDTKEGHVIGDMAKNLNEKYGFVARKGDKQLFAYHPEDGVYKPDGETFAGEKLFEGLQWRNYEDRYTRKSSNMLTLNNLKEADEIGDIEGKLSLENCILDISDPNNPKVEDHTPEYLLTSSFPPSYDQYSEPDEFLDFLKESVPDTKERRKLQEYVGYCLHTWDQPFKKAMMLVGPTDSGKGTFIRILEALIGQDNVSHQSLKDLCDEDDRWSDAQLSTGVLNIRNEMTTDSLSHMERFKEMTGRGDTTTAEFKGQDKFDFTVTQKFLFATNEVPAVEGDEAFYNRWLHVKFPNTVPTEEQDPELANRIIENELSGVLNWALEGYARLMDQQQFSAERATQEKRSIWSEYGDSIDRFIESEIVKDSSSNIPKNEVREAYQDYCDERGTPNLDKGGELTKRLKSDSDITDGHKGSRGNQTPVYKGITMKGYGSDGDENVKEEDIQGPW